MDVQLRKLQDLDLGSTYTVLSYTPIETKYDDTFILTCRDYCALQKEFKMYATKILIQYITNTSPQDKFSFVVKRTKRKKYTYAEIDNYNPFT